MRKADVLDLYGSNAAIAAALHITVQAVSQWGDVVPEKSAYKLQAITRGRVKVDPDLYTAGSSRAQRLRNQATA